MTRVRIASWLPLASMLMLAIATLGGLMIGVAGDQIGKKFLPTPDARLEVLPDPGRRFVFPDILDQPESAWRPWTSSYYIQAFDGGAVWVRVTLTNPTAHVRHGVLADDELILDHLDCWTRDDDNPAAWRQQSSGEAVPGPAKPIWGRNTAVYVNVPAHGRTIAYLRAQDHFGVWLRTTWWPEQRDFLAAQLRATLAEAVYFGVLVALFIYNGVLWARLRHRDLGFYLGYLGSLAVFMALARELHQLLGLPLTTPFLEVPDTVMLASTGFFFVQFAREFLGLRTVAPRLDRVARWLGWLNLVFLVGSVWLLWSRTSVWLHLVIPGVAASHGLMLVGAVIAWRAGVRHARFFLLSFGLFLAGALPFIANWLLAIPLGNTALCLMLGSALEMLLLSLAMADRFAQLQRDRHAARLAEEKTRLELLRYQLNPHFLFNALNSIYGLVYPHSRPAGDLVLRLADFCRITFSHDGGRWRALGEELTMLRQYLDIEQARWRDRLAVEFINDPAVASATIPPFLLLPLTENAVKHGGATSPNVLGIRITTRPGTPGTVVIEIANTGRWQPADEPKSVSSTGIGLENLRARLQRSFPDSHRLDISEADGWVAVKLQLPAN